MPAGIDSAAHDDQNQNHGHCNSNQTAASTAVSAATAIIVISAATAARRTAKVAVESRHVLGIARVAFAELAVITVCHCIFLHPKCVLLLLRSFYRK